MKMRLYPLTEIHLATIQLLLAVVRVRELNLKANANVWYSV